TSTRVLPASPSTFGARGASKVHFAQPCRDIGRARISHETGGNNMTGTLARRAFQVAGIAAGIVLFGGGIAQAASPSTSVESGHHGHDSSSVKLDQDATNVCGNNAGNGGVFFNLTYCDATNVAADGSGHYAS